jgi:hypothetical protein
MSIERFELQDKIKFGIACETGEWVRSKDHEIEIKKLRDTLEDLEKQLDKTRRDVPWGIARQNMDAIIKEALKDGE